MPEAKNTFLKAKMNQDLDDRLLPNGEYRTAQNILVGKSEDDSVGTLENIKGNELLVGFDEEDDAQIIGRYIDSTNDRMFIFVTNNKESVPASEATPPTGGTIFCSIYIYYPSNNASFKIVGGNFLNFSTQSPILSVNLLEDLLFWTDNRNQPRKINVTHSLGYYTEEHQISVAKYNPYQPISLVKQEIELATTAINGSNSFDVAENAGIEVGMSVLSLDPTNSVEIITAYDYVSVTDVSTSAGVTTVTVSNKKDSTAPSVSIGDELYFVVSTMSDQSENQTWPGDPSYLESRFVRFGYRFKFDDNEYSIFSPFTQVAFMPKQKGYFLNGQERLAYGSTILEWFENSVNNIDLIIPLPDKAYNVINSYKITEIEILYKESDQVAVKVVDTIPMSNLNQESNSSNNYIYSYQSRKPIRTLPEAQTVRVYDKVPVVAKVQEVSGNRIIYGNFKTKHTPPKNINYDISVQKKISRAGRTNFIEYPNHTVKQNRNYQVGFVLSDKYGRQSDVILSPVTRSAIPGYSGSTVFAPYVSDDPLGSGNVDDDFFPEGVLNWFGNSILMSVNSPITSGTTTPLYAEPKGNNGFYLQAGSTTTITDSSYTFTLSSNPGVGTNIPARGDYLRGKFVDYVKVTNVTGANPYVVTTDGRVNDLYLLDPSLPDNIKFAYNINPLGWYSYKIVVKQTEQEYYNVYLPGAIASNNAIGNDPLVDGSTDTAASVSYITLINDNINKVPRDLSQVGPDQKQYRSSVRLFGRVQPIQTGTGVSTDWFNTQFYPSNVSDVSTAVGNNDDLLGDFGTTDKDRVIYQYASNPIVARVSTNKQFGENWDIVSSTNDPLRFQLSIYETEPVTSNLDIYWETTQAGYISDLNWDVRNDFTGPVGWGEQQFFFTEDKTINDDISSSFDPVDGEGNAIDGTSISSFSVFDNNGVNGTQVDDKFIIEQDLITGQYKVKINTLFEYTYNSSIQDVYKFTVTLQDNDPNSSWGEAELSFSIPLENIAPTFDGQTPPSPPLVVQEYYYFTDDNVEGDLVRWFAAQNNPSNGSAISPLNQTDLVWTMTGPDTNLFNLDRTTGKLTLSAEGAAAGNNTYSIDVTLTDASESNPNVEDVNALFVTKTILIGKGFARTNVINGNSTRGLNHYSDFIDPNTGNPDNTDAVFYQYYYLSNNTDYTADDFPTVLLEGNNLFRIPENVGNALQIGAFTFGIEKAEAQFIEFAGDPEVPIASEIKFWAYHRDTPNDSWSLQDDSNKFGRGNGLSGDEPFQLNYVDNYSNEFGNGTNPGRSYVWYSQSTEGPGNGNNPGEYAFLVKTTLRPNSIFTGEASSSEFETTATVRVRDLHYTGSLQTQQVYKYEIYEDGKATNRDSATDSGTATIIYADNPLVEYNLKFFSDNELANVYEPPFTSAFYYVVKLAATPEGDPNYDLKRRPRGGTNFPTERTQAIAKIDANGDVDNSLAPIWKVRLDSSLGYQYDNRLFANRATTDDTNTYFNVD